MSKENHSDSTEANRRTFLRRASAAATVPLGIVASVDEVAGSVDFEEPLERRAGSASFGPKQYQGAYQPGTESTSWYGNPNWTYRAAAAQTASYDSYYSNFETRQHKFRFGGYAFGARRDTLDRQGRHNYKIIESQFPSWHVAQQKAENYPLHVPTPMITGQAYEIEVTGDLTLVPNSHYRTFHNQSGLWKLGKIRTYEPDQRTSLAEATYEAILKPPESPEGFALKALTNEDFVTRWAPFMAEGLGKLASVAGTTLTLLDIWDSLAKNCDAWEDRDTTEEFIKRKVNVCAGSGAGHFVAIDAVAPVGGSGEIIFRSQFEVGNPINETRTIQQSFSV